MDSTLRNQMELPISYTCDRHGVSDPSDGSADIETADAVYGTVPPELFVPAKKQRWICVVCWSGYEALVNSNIVVTGMRAVATSIFLHTRWRSRPPLPGDSSTTYRGSVRRRRDTPRSSLSVCGLFCSLLARPEQPRGSRDASCRRDKWRNSAR